MYFQRSRIVKSIVAPWTRIFFLLEMISINGNIKQKKNNDWDKIRSSFYLQLHPKEIYLPINVIFQLRFVMERFGTLNTNMIFFFFLFLDQSFMIIAKMLSQSFYLTKFFVATFTFERFIGILARCSVYNFVMFIFQMFTECTLSSNYHSTSET